MNEKNYNKAPNVAQMAIELGIKPKPAWHNKLPSFLVTLIGNKKGLIGALLLLSIVLTSAFAPLIANHNPMRRTGGAHEKPSFEHYLGTTRVGKDVFSQLVYGGRASLTVGFVAALVATIVGAIIGISAGYFGGRIDEVLTFLVNVVLVLPALPLIIVIASFTEEASPAVIGLVLAATGWGFAARTIRTQTLSIKSREYIMAAELSGEKKWRIILVEIFPNMTSYVVGGFVLATIYAILAEAGLEFIGLGDPGAITWGTMLFWAQKNIALEVGAWWEVWPPAIAIMVSGASLVMINFAVDEITSPQLRAMKIARKTARYLKKCGRSNDVF